MPLNKLPVVVNINKSSLREAGYEDLGQWLQNPHHIYIGRKVRFVPDTFQSKWANPFSKKLFGHARCVEMYGQYLKSNPELLCCLEELEGKVLGCWCKPGPSHGDILVEKLKFRSE